MEKMKVKDSVKIKSSSFTQTLILAMLLGNNWPSLVAEDAKNPTLFDKIEKTHQLTPEMKSKMEAIFKQGSSTQGNPATTQHPVSQAQCEEQAKTKNVQYQNPEFATICGSPYMVPIYDTQSQKPNEATVCIDEFEFPNIPCEYPVVWVKASEAHQICQAMGKRMCDAHEWENGCAGRTNAPDYAFSSLNDKMSANDKQKVLRQKHNAKRPIVWAYGDKKNHKLCGTSSTKTDACNKALAKGGSVYQTCGSNTYPTGYFLDCKSPAGVYDQHGNAAEHMSLPLSESQKTSKGGTGVTEMKGSWFIFSAYEAHQDDCHWRAPYWHGSEVMVSHSHSNYHLGFRCCKDIKK